MWKLGTKLLGLMWSSYFDDFFSLTEVATCRHTDLLISSLFGILGWRLSADKLIAYDTVCRVLGVKFGLVQSGVGLAAHVLNTEERVSELCEKLDEIVRSGRLKRSEGEKLRGRILFAAGQLFGRFARHQVRLLSMHIQSGRVNLSEETTEALQSIRAHLEKNVPRKIMGSLSDHVHIYVDASFDEGDYAGVGGALYDSHGRALFFFSEEVSPMLIADIRSDGQVTLIQELEMLALLVVPNLWIPPSGGFIDSESVRGAFLKTWSNNSNNNHLLAQIFRVEEKSMCQIWLERVPSQFNPVDVLSREKTDSWMGLRGNP